MAGGVIPFSQLAGGDVYSPARTARVSPNFPNKPEDQVFNSIFEATQWLVSLGLSATARGLVIIYEGEYLNDSIGGYSYIDYVGLNKGNCRIKRSDTYIVVTFDKRGNKYLNLTFEHTGSNRCATVQSAGTLQDQVIGCDFIVNADVNAIGMYQFGDTFFKDCRVIGASEATKIIVQVGTSDDSKARFEECDLAGTIELSTGTIGSGVLELVRCNHNGVVNGKGGNHFLSSRYCVHKSSTKGFYFESNNNFELIHTHIEAGGTYAIEYGTGAGGTSHYLWNCSLVSSGIYDIYSPSAGPEIKGRGNKYSKGCNGKIKVQAVRKTVGTLGCVFNKFEDALESASSGDVLIMESGVSVVSAYTIIGKSIYVEGNEMVIQRSAGNPIVIIGTGGKLVIGNAKLIGSLDVNGDGAALILRNKSEVAGLIDIQAGNGSTLVVISQSKVVGDNAEYYAIRIADSDPVILLREGAEAIGYSGYPAIYWAAGSDNGNLMVENSKVKHGSSGNPFGRDTTQTPSYVSHHSAYNSDPESGGIWLNLIAPGQRFDTMDVNV